MACLASRPGVRASSVRACYNLPEQHRRKNEGTGAPLLEGGERRDSTGPHWQRAPHPVTATCCRTTSCHTLRCSSLLPSWTHSHSGGHDLALCSGQALFTAQGHLCGRWTELLWCTPATTRLGTRWPWPSLPPPSPPRSPARALVGAQSAWAVAGGAGDRLVC